MTESVVVLVVAAGYAVGARRAKIPRRATAAATTAFVAALCVVLLHDAADRRFAAHMVQHVLIVVVVAPLLVLARPRVAMAGLAPRGTRWGARRAAAARRLLGAGGAAPLVLGVHALSLAVWHLPWTYEAAVRSHPIHALEHATIGGFATVFWYAVVRSRRSASGGGVLLVFAAAAIMGVFGALLTFSSVSWYAVHGGDLADQRLGGVIMWVMAGFAYLAAALAGFAAWLREAERRTGALERATRC